MQDFIDNGSFPKVLNDIFNPTVEILKDQNKGQANRRLLTIHRRLHPLIKTSIVNTKTMMNHF
jgi:hypothetical protein